MTAATTTTATTTKTAAIAQCTAHDSQFVVLRRFHNRQDQYISIQICRQNVVSVLFSDSAKLFNFHRNKLTIHGKTKKLCKMGLQHKM